MRKKCLQMVYELARQDQRIVFIGSDLGFGTLDQFKREMPERFFMEGIAESCVLGMAAGLAQEGKIVYVNTIAPFFYRRALEQIALDLCLHNVPVRMIANGGGLVYAPLGPTHLAFEDIGILCTQPNLTILAPADAREMAKLMPLTVDHPGPIYIRLAKGYDPIVTPPDQEFRIGRAYVLRKGSDVLLTTYGICLGPALEAADLLGKQGIKAGVLHCPTLKPFDHRTLLQTASQVQAVVCIEEHSRIGGLGAIVAHSLLQAGVQPMPRYAHLALPDCFPEKYGTQNGLLAHYQITAKILAEKTSTLLRTS